ncbi:hypothetical protein FRC04_010428 [Tulasnella sp. 424]|nr:hypothetical protein FRC04_010428 [Tulasnella sp. 424]
MSSGGGSEHYIQEPDQIIPSADAEAFVSITADLFHVIGDLEESERRGAPTIVESSRQTTSPTVWVAYYRALENRAADLVQRWDAITPTAIRNSARLTRIHQDEAINKILHAVRSNNLRQFDELHFDWENHRHPVLASTRVDPQSADLPLDVPRSSLHMEHARGVSGVIHQSRTAKLCTYDEIELTYYRNEEALEAKRRQLAQRSTTAGILPLGYMKGALEKRLATGLTVPVTVEPLPLEPMLAETPKSQEGSTVTQWLHDAHGHETVSHGRTDRQISEPPNGAGNQRRRSAPNVNKPLPPAPSDMSVCSTSEEEAEPATPQREHSTRVPNRSEADSDATDRALSSTTVLNRSKSAAPEVRRRDSTWFRDHRERERINQIRVVHTKASRPVELTRDPHTKEG